MLIPSRVFITEPFPIGVAGPFALEVVLIVLPLEHHFKNTIISFSFVYSYPGVFIIDQDLTVYLF